MECYSQERRLLKSPVSPNLKTGQGIFITEHSSSTDRHNLSVQQVDFFFSSEVPQPLCGGFAS